MTIAKDSKIPQPLLLDIGNTDIHISPEQLERLRRNNPSLTLGLTPDGKLTIDPQEVDLSISISQKRPPKKLP
jgi:hypothetical protein